jgi:hypothetical protein
MGTATLALALHDPEGRTVAGVDRARKALAGAFPSVVLNATTETHPSVLAAFSSFGDAEVVVHPPDESKIGDARRDAVRIALACGAEQVLYSDGDHILRWIEARPDEVAAVLDDPADDLTVVGRTPDALLASPRRLHETEAVVNHIYGLMRPGRAWDLMFAVRRLNRAAGQVVVDQCRAPTVANDVEWPLAVEEAGLRVGYFPADGLSYRTIGHFDREPDRLDDDPEAWIRRVEIAADHVSTMRPYL